MSTLHNVGRSALRVGKNYIKGYSDVQTKVRDATSNDPWGPSGTQMNELAQLSYNQNDFVEIVEILDKRLNDKGKNWRHVFKALTVLDYLLHAGSEHVVMYFRDNIYVVKTLKEFQYIDEYGKDQGANVRQKAKNISNLLSDVSRLREERRARASMRDRMAGSRSRGSLEDGGGYDSDTERRRRAEAARRQRERQGTNHEDKDLERAIEESKRMQREEEEKQKKQKQNDDDLAKAIRLSREEEEKRQKQLEDSNQQALFNDGTQLDGFNAYQNQQVDFFGNPIGQQQTGFPLVDVSVNGQQSQIQPQLQPQSTSFNPYAGYNPFLQQQMEQQRQAELLAQQQQMEYQRQMEQQQQMMMMQQQQAAFAQQQQQPLQPQPTALGSNNPFNLFASPSPAPPMPVQQQQLQPSTSPQPVFQPPSPKPASPLSSSFTNPTTPDLPKGILKNANRPMRTGTDGEHAKLAALLSNREDGIDTFGNVGNLRIPVGSNYHPSNRMEAQKTGQQQQPQPTGSGTFGGSMWGAGAGPSGQQQAGDSTNNSNPFFTI